MTEKSLRGWIITTTKQKAISKSLDFYMHLSKNVRELYERGLSLGLSIEVFTPDEIGLVICQNEERIIFINDKEQELPDFIIPRTGSGTTKKALRLYQQLENLGVASINNFSSINASIDKFKHLQTLANNGLPIPKTVYLSSFQNITAIEHYLGYPMVLKTWPSSSGNGIFLAKDKHSLYDLIGMLDIANSQLELLAQEYIEESKGKDVRVFILDDKVMGTAERQAVDGSFKSNLDRGGTLTRISLNAEAKKMALAAVKHLGLECAGVDLLYSNGSFKICEVNSAPGFKTVKEGSEHDPSSIIYDYIFKKLNLCPVQYGSEILPST